MAAPVPHAPEDNTGAVLGNGYGARLVFSSNPTVPFEEVEVTPPGWEGGEPLDLSNHHNKKYRTKAPRRLIDMTDAELTVNYSTDMVGDIEGLVNHHDTITVWWPDNAHVAFYGYLRTFKPGRLVDGEKPSATVTVVVTNTDPATCKEAGPTWVASTGTGVAC
jgi:hypothetical protein